PKSVAVIGASNQPRSVGGLVMRNLLAGGFAGPVMPVSAEYDAVCGVLSYPDVARLPKTPDLAILCTPAPPLPGLIADPGERGTRGAVVLTACLGEGGRDDGSLAQAMRDAARPHLLRILGPDCVGLIVPGIGLNATIVGTRAPAGKLAFISH